MAEQWSNGVTIIYAYDSTGSPVGMLYRTANYAADVFDTYLFQKNLQGDVIAVYNKSGTKLVGYVYDAWGNVSTTYSNGGASTGAQYNPFTYRGYYPAFGTLARWREDGAASVFTMTLATLIWRYIG